MGQFADLPVLTIDKVEHGDGISGDLLPVAKRREPRPVLGYAMVMTAATLWAVNGTVSKVILTTGLSSLRLAEVRFRN